MRTNNLWSPVRRLTPSAPPQLCTRAPPQALEDDYNQDIPDAELKLILFIGGVQRFAYRPRWRRIRDGSVQSAPLSTAPKAHLTICPCVLVSRVAQAELWERQQVVPKRALPLATHSSYTFVAMVRSVP